jgi:hypothetical protein
MAERARGQKRGEIIICHRCRKRARRIPAFPRLRPQKQRKRAENGPVVVPRLLGLALSPMERSLCRTGVTWPGTKSDQSARSPIRPRTPMASSCFRRACHERFEKRAATSAVGDEAFRRLQPRLVHACTITR